MFTDGKKRLNFLNCLKLIEVFSNSLMYPLICNKIPAIKIDYCGKIWRKTEILFLSYDPFNSCP